MSRKTFTIWFAIFIILQWLLTTPLVGTLSFMSSIIAMVILTLLLSSILGFVYVGLICYDNIPDLWCCIFNNMRWLDIHSHGIGTPGFSYDSFWLTYVQLLASAIVVVIHLYFCYKRCKDIGISPWWILVPLYNPFVLLYRKSCSNGE